MLVVGEGWLALSCASESSKKPTGICDDRRDQPSRSRKSSDSSPSLLSVDSKRRVEGARRPV